MLVSLEWLKEFVDLHEAPAEVAKALTMAGLEVESGAGRETDGVVFEVNITPNRPDCLSVLGVARELSAVLKRPLKSILEEPVEALFDCPVTVHITDTALCHRYAGRVITGVRIDTSPQWLIDRLEASGVRSINNVVDVTNYVLMEMGHPLHAFDLSTLQGNTIQVAIAGQEQEMTTLDQVKRKVPASALLIRDGQRPVAVAGVIGGANTQVTGKTVDIFLESAWFDPGSIRRTSKLLGVSTESSYRFERGADIEAVALALDRAAALILRLCGGRPSTLVDVHPVKLSPAPVGLDVARAARVLGIPVTEAEAEDILRRLSFEVRKSDGLLLATPPSFRRDIGQEADLYEEIARIYGYERIPSVMPSVQLSPGVENSRYKRVNAIKDWMHQAGVTETINYSFMSLEAFQLLNIPADDPRRRAVKLKNPLVEEHSLLRTFLLPSLVRDLRHNMHQGVEDIRLYETATVFIDEGGQLPVERLHLGVLFYEGETARLWKEPGHIFFRLKGLIEGLLCAMGISSWKVTQSSKEPFLAEGLCADIELGQGGRVGSLGILSPEVIRSLDIDAAKPMAAVAELSLDILFQAEKKPVKYAPLPKYPAIMRDMALLVPDEYPAEDIVQLIRHYPDNRIVLVEIFDFYKGKNIPEGQKNLAFHITYRSLERTLTDEEIDGLHKEVVEFVIGRTGGVLRSF